MTAATILATGPFQYASDALLSDELFCAPGPGVTIDSIAMQHVHGFSESASTLYLQLHEGAAPPAPGAVPLICIKIPAGLTGSWSPAGTWQSYGGELGWYVSSTAATYTASVETCWINAQGIANVGVL